MSWHLLAEAAPALAGFGEARLHDQIAYLATIRPDGSPRLHPVRPIVSAGRLFVFMEPTSPKGHDLRHDGRYVLHCSATDPGGQPWELHEFCVEGRATPVRDAATRQIANAGTSFPRDEHLVLFEFTAELARSTVYDTSGRPIRQRWPR
jgi:Pyridoxamine 5'-phosphate oxidase